MKKGKEKKRNDLICDYSGKEFSSSKSHTRFSSSKNRFYFFAKKKVLLAHIQSLELIEIKRFNDFLQIFLKKGAVGQEELLGFVREHKQEMHRLEGKRVNVEDILIEMKPSQVKLTKENLQRAMNIVLPKSQ